MPVISSPSVAVILGTRPEAIKLAPIVRALRSAGHDPLVVATGQHAQLAREALALFGIEPDVDLALMRARQTLDYLLAAAIREVGELLDDQQPAAVIVQGDTTSMLGASLAAFHRHIPVAHVEAGLRSGDMEHPFPEEMNRRAASILARWHFAPTRRAAANLAGEGIEAGVHVTGNTVVDALRTIVGEGLGPLPADLARFTGERPYILATAHRREAWNGGIEAVANALRDVLETHDDLGIVFVTHPNPVARGPVDAALGQEPRARVIDALDYRSFLALLGRARLAVSDSGGVQEEGATLGVPVLVTRSTTERPEGVEAGAVMLIGTDRENVRTCVETVLTDDALERRMRAAARDLYGDGHAAERIAEILAREGLPGRLP